MIFSRLVQTPFHGLLRVSGNRPNADPRRLRAAGVAQGPRRSHLVAARTGRGYAVMWFQAIRISLPTRG
jgi:hypothetical protein